MVMPSALRTPSSLMAFPSIQKTALNLGLRSGGNLGITLGFGVSLRVKWDRLVVLLKLCHRLDRLFQLTDHVQRKRM